MLWTAEYDDIFNKWLYAGFRLKIDDFQSLPTKQQLAIFECFVRCDTQSAMHLHYYSSLWRLWGWKNISKIGYFDWDTLRRRRGLFSRWSCLTTVNKQFKPYSRISFEKWVDEYIFSVNIWEFKQLEKYYLTQLELLKIDLFKSSLYKPLYNCYNIFSAQQLFFKHAPMPLDLFHYIVIPNNSNYLWNCDAGELFTEMPWFLRVYAKYMIDMGVNNAFDWLYQTECKHKNGDLRLL